MSKIKVSAKVLLASGFLLATLVLFGCAVKFVSDYDSSTFEETLKIGKEVDRFYGDLLETPDSTRQYGNYSDKYVAIEIDLRSLYMRNGAKPLNKESTRISEIILNDWIKYKGRHAKANGYSDGTAKLDRNRFSRLFVSALNAEEAKKMTSSDQKADQNPK